MKTGYFGVATSGQIVPVMWTEEINPSKATIHRANLLILPLPMLEAKKGRFRRVLPVETAHDGKIFWKCRRFDYCT